MATGGETQDKELPVSPEASSDQIIEHACHPCLDVDIKESSGYCVDCEEWLCSDCFRYHTRQKPLRHHFLLSKEELKQTGTVVQSKDICTIKCDKHENRYIEYYCPSHDYFGCSKCFIKDHKACEEQSIDELSSGEDKLFSSRLASIEEALDTVEDQSRHNIQMAEKSNGQVLEAFGTFRKDIITALDIAENKILSESSKYKDDEITRMESVSKQCNTIVTEVRTIQTEVEQFENKGQYCNAFVCFKKGETSIESLEAKVNKLENFEPTRQLIFTPNASLKKLLEQSAEIGTLKIECPPSNINHVEDIDIKSARDTDCWITASVILSENRLVVIDLGNTKLKVIDTKQQKLMSELSLPDNPWSMAKKTDNEVVIAYPTKLVFVNIQSTLSIGNKISLEKIALKGKCLDICVSDDKLLTIFKNPSKLCILNMQGDALRIIDTNDQGQPLFSDPQYVVKASNAQMVYVSNFSNDSIVCVGLDGKVKARYTDNELKGPEQVTLDRFGRVYVCGFYSKNIHMLTPDLQKIKVFSSELDGVKAALSLSYCDEEVKLYVGMYKNNYIKVFQLS